MGNGKFVNGKLNFIVSASYALSAAEKTAWKTSLQSGSDFLFQATGGQIQFGDIYIVDNNFGKVDAEIILIDDPNGLTGGTYGNFGVPNKAVHFYKPDRNQPPIFVHELSHHIWNLGDEYSGPMVAIQLDKSIASPDKSTIPVIGGPAANTLVGQSVIITFGTINQRKTIVSNTPTQIVVNVAFTDFPTNSSENFGFIQNTFVFCGHPSVTHTNFCIMEDVTGQATTFCDAGNHDAAQPTDQQVRHQNSCWEKIIATTGFGGLSVPVSLPVTPPSAVNFIDLDKLARLAVVFDISGSMTGDKLIYTKEGVKYWIDNCSLADDNLSIIAYKASNNILLPITSIGSYGDIAQLETTIDNLNAGGRTNIRDAVREGINQIASLHGRSVTQAVIVLTDGKHNRPPGTSLTEAITDLVSGGVRAMTIGIGDPADVNIDDLDDLAVASNGLSFFVGLSNPIDIETALIEANLFVRGGIIDSDFTDFVPSPPQKKYGPKINKLYKDKKNPRLREILKIVEISYTRLQKDLQLLIPELFKTKKVFIERGCEQVNFTINYRMDAEVDLFLMDPAGNSVEINNSTVKKISQANCHKIIVVEKPDVGEWTIILLARKLSLVAAKTTVNITVGGKNRLLNVWGQSDKKLYKNRQKVNITGNANFNATLTGIKVSAAIRSSTGALTNATLSDGNNLAQESGNYRTELTGLKKGKYKGLITFEGKGKNIIQANGYHTAFHSKANSFDLRMKALDFKRVVPIYFEIL